MNQESRPMAPRALYAARGIRGRDGVIKFQCRWPNCLDFEWDLYENMHLCQVHALHVWSVVDAGIKAAASEPQPVAEPGPAAKVKHGWIYYLRIGEQIKIGYASDLKRRMRSYPPNTELLARHPGSTADEQGLHVRFMSHRSAGREWYNPTPAILDHIAAMVREHGVPPDPFRGRQARPARQPVSLRSRTRGRKDP